MSAASVHVYDDKTAVVSATVEIDSLSQLSRLLEKLEQVRDGELVVIVIRVGRRRDVHR